MASLSHPALAKVSLLSLRMQVSPASWLREQPVQGLATILTKLLFAGRNGQASQETSLGFARVPYVQAGVAKEVGTVKSGAVRLTCPRAGRVVVIILVVAVVVLGGAAAAWWVFLRTTPEDIVAQFMEAERAQDEDAVRSLMSQDTVKMADEMQARLSAQFADSGAPIDTEYPFLSGLARGLVFGVERVEKARVEGNTATVPLKRKTPSGAPMREMAFLREIKLVKEGGKWKIDMTDYLKRTARFMEGFGEVFAEIAPKMREMAEGMARDFGEETGAPATSEEDLVAAGMAAKRAGRLDEAASTFRQAIQHDPDNVDAHWGLAWVLADQGKKPEAVAEFGQVAEMATDQTMRDEAKAAIQRLR